MGVIITKQGIEENSFTWEYYCDTYEDMESIAQQNVTIGSYCTLLNGENGVEIYTGDGNHQWVLITPSIRDKYSADNDGKVILNGNALSQTNLTITENGTFNTTLNNSIEVLVEPSLQNKTVTTNGVVTHDNNYYGLDQVTVNVPNSYEDEDEDKVVYNGELVEQTSRTITENGTYDTTLNNEVIITTENVYEENDEGKVVSSGELISQTSTTKTENGTYDTTTNNEIIINIPTYEIEEPLIINTNGTYNALPGKAYTSIIVEV